MSVNDLKTFEKRLKNLGVTQYGALPTYSYKMVDDILIQVMGGDQPSTAKIEEIREEKPTPNKVKKPCSIKRGDVFIGASINYKSRPFVCVKRYGNGWFCIALTSTENEYSLIPYSSRFLGNGFLSNNLIYVSSEFILDRFVGILDDSTSILKAFRLIKKDLTKKL